MASSFNNFCEECKEALRVDRGPAGQEQVRLNLEKLLADSDFIDEYCKPGLTVGSHHLYTDDEFGFTVLVYAAKWRGISPAHDHGNDWAIYGQAVKKTSMVDYRISSGSIGEAPEHVGLKEIRAFDLLPGRVVLYKVGAIHSIAPEEGCRYIRIAGSPADHFTPVGPMSDKQREIWGPIFTQRPDST